MGFARAVLVKPFYLRAHLGNASRNQKRIPILMRYARITPDRPDLTLYLLRTFFLSSYTLLHIIYVYMLHIIYILQMPRDGIEMPLILY